MFHNNIHALTYSVSLCTTWYPKPAAGLLRDFQAMGSMLKQSAAFNTEERGRKDQTFFLI